MAAPELRVIRAAEIRERSGHDSRWLVEPLWSAGAVGVIGGAPKSCKTWLALELAVAVASGRPCLDRFAVPRPGPALVFAAEDAPDQVKGRLEHLARARRADFHALDVRLIVEPALRLDRAADLQRLRLTLARHRPRLLVLDPYVRLQRVDENDARQVSTILSALRDLSRTFETAVALVHHARKHGAELPGQALRGSGDFWAWGDSNLYLARRRDGLLLTIEHRAAPSPPPLGLHLVAPADELQNLDLPVHLEIRDPSSSAHAASLATRLVVHLREAGPTRHRDLRGVLRVRDTHLSQALRDLEATGHVIRTPRGWSLPAGG